MPIQIIIPDPPTYMDIGQSKPRRYYLTAQLFYSGINHHVRRKIVEDIKWSLFQYLRPLPVLRPRLQLDFTMRNENKRTQDPDNLFFFVKVVLDLMKGKSIPDDSKKYISRVSMGFGVGPPALEIMIQEGL